MSHTVPISFSRVYLFLSASLVILPCHLEVEEAAITLPVGEMPEREGATTTTTTPLDVGRDREIDLALMEFLFDSHGLM